MYMRLAAVALRGYRTTYGNPRTGYKIQSRSVSNVDVHLHSRPQVVDTYLKFDAMAIRRVCCTGDAYQIGLQHGGQAAEQVKGSIRFYSAIFETYTGRTWEELMPVAVSFGKTIKAKWPSYYLEMQGLADGAGCRLCDVLALNVRTEIAFGLLSPDRLVLDGCTSLFCDTKEGGRMGQNWDWMEEQKENIILLTIEQIGMPVIKMVTEAGIIGKIGMNSKGVGVCLNAIRCIGNDTRGLPIHLALRMTLESDSIWQASKKIEAAGAGGSGFLLMGQGNESVGVELTSKTVKRINKDLEGRITHTNHLLLEHQGSEEWPEDDSFARFDRMKKLTSELKQAKGMLESEDFLDIFDDHEGAPEAICRSQEGACKDATLFNILMNLRDRSAVVRIGKICRVEEVIEFGF